MTPEEKKIFDDFNNAGWIAFYHPRKKKIAINGRGDQSIKDAIKYMREALKSK
jgi:hypothetical protein